MSYRDLLGYVVEFGGRCLGRAIACHSYFFVCCHDGHVCMPAGISPFGFAMGTSRMEESMGGVVLHLVGIVIGAVVFVAGIYVYLIPQVFPATSLFLTVGVCAAAILGG
jgi:hypothetical protein